MEDVSCFIPKSRILLFSPGRPRGALQPAAMLCMQEKLHLPGHWWMGYSLYQVQAPQAIQHISFHTDNTTTTTKSEDGHYARTDYAGTVPIL